jgi:predicted nucleic acid-binding protein
MFLDTNIIIEMFRFGKGTDEFKRIFEQIEDEVLFISIFQMGEIADWSLANGIDPSEPIGKVKKMANIVPLSEDICVQGSRIKHEMRKKGVAKFGLADGLILASARSVKQSLLTMDEDFKKARDVVVLK